ncbi:Uncharacterized protein HZ326_25576 [Fusarium oxysporum f. sp. albedinis]|nr:Uncharacterized protein HZ326_25576 [Fusarium oxysporum f. sp. albedinis]
MNNTFPPTGFMTTRQVAMRLSHTGYPVMTPKEILLASLWIFDRRGRLKADIIEACECLRAWYGKPRVEENNDSEDSGNDDDWLFDVVLKVLASLMVLLVLPVIPYRLLCKHLVWFGLTPHTRPYQTIPITVHNEHVFYQHAAPHPQSLFSLPVATESPDRIRLRVFFLYTIMYICRVLATLSPTEIERATSEVEAQMFASQALLIEEVATKLDPAMAWHLQQRNGLAHSIIEKKEEWFSDNELGMSRDKLKSFLAQRWLKWENSWRAGVLAEELGENEV